MCLAAFRKASHPLYRQDEMADVKAIKGLLNLLLKLSRNIADEFECQVVALRVDPVKSFCQSPERAEGRSDVIGQLDRNKQPLSPECEILAHAFTIGKIDPNESQNTLQSGGKASKHR